MNRDTLIAIIICIAILLTGFILSTGSTIGFFLLPLITAGAGLILGREKNGKWNWKDGLMWGVIGAAASFLFSLAV